jgi:DNA-binding XRE family transcriptional regulator
VSKETPIQRIKVAGEYYVLMPLEEYDAIANSANLISSRLREPKEVKEVRNETPVFSEGKSKLRSWRKHRDLTQIELAKRAKISASYFVQIENGSRTGKPALWRALAEALNVSIEEILPES